MSPRTLSCLIALSSLVAAAPAPAATKPAKGSAAAKATPAEAKAFFDKTNAELKKLWVNSSTGDWIKNTYITDDTERNAALLNEAAMGYVVGAIKESVRFVGLDLDPQTSRMLYLLRMAAIPLPAPSEKARREELAGLSAKLEGMYGKGKWCGKDGKAECRDLEKLSKVMRESRDWNALLDAWSGWHGIAVPMRPMYARLVELANQGARELGFGNTGDLWRSPYDMKPEEFEKETDRLWQQVRPLYEQLHCYVRAQLQKQYGKDKVPDKKPIPAHILGNMWAQEWGNVYSLVEPYKGQGSLDLTERMKQLKWDEKKMVKTAEAFFTSLGLDPLPETFWERSMFVKPKDRDVVCHASAWDVTFDNDLRIKMCIEVKEEDLVTLHHELGHNYYFHYYYKMPVLFQQGANDGFHEAIGDALVLSMTPGYLKQLGLLDKLPADQKGLINQQMKDALERIAFLPFGKLIDQWRWDVFSGKTKQADYNKAWWELRRKYQGVDSPIARSESDFDPGAKYHIPASVPYTRYFLARILQFQFHRAMCQAAGIKGPLHECSIYGNKAAGEKLKNMLALGASKPWPEALEALTGQRQMDATAILDYFAPLQAWLKEQNKTAQCGW